MTSSRQRQREAARAKLAREMAARQEAARRRRRRNTIIGSAVAAVLVVGLVVLVVNQVTDREDLPPFSLPTSTPTPTPPGPCEFRPDDNPMAVDVGLPPEGEPREGIQVMTITTNLGEIEVEMDLSRSPCIAASFTHLAGHEFFDGTKCHRMMQGMLQCGDPNAKGEGYRDTDGTGGPGYRFNDENLPTQRVYPAGTVAMANSGRDTNGSQFFLVYEDLHLNPDYSIVGTITKGLDILRQVAEAGHDGAFDPLPGGGHPNQEVIIESLRVSDPR